MCHSYRKRIKSPTTKSGAFIYGMLKWVRCLVCTCTGFGIVQALHEIFPNDALEFVEHLYNVTLRVFRLFPISKII